MRRARAADKVEVTFANWAAAEGTTKPAIDQVIADFEKAHPDVHIKSKAISFSEIACQLALRVKAGNPPDVAQLAGNGTAQAQALERISTDPIVVGIRPEHLTLVTEREVSATDVSVRGRVEMVEMLGAEQYVHVKTESGSLTVKVDETVILAAIAPDLHLFDHETGLALR